MRPGAAYPEPGRADGVLVKIEAFLLTRYGILRGKVMNVPLDAVADEKRGRLSQTSVAGLPWRASGCRWCRGGR